MIRKRTSSFKPGLEALEVRCLLSAGALQWSETLPTSAIFTVSATAIQPADGKIVAVGGAYAGQIKVTRLNPNGTLDTTFNGTGTAAIPISNNGRDASGMAVAIQSNGQIVVGGYAGLNSYGDTEYIVARLNANGSLDKQFGKAGVFVYNPTPYSESVKSLAILPSGVILAGATQTSSVGNVNFAAFELTPTGTWNTAFGSGGVALVRVGSGAGLGGMSVVSGTGQIVMAGYAVQQSVKYGCVVTLTASGRPDPSFNGTGSLIAVNSSVSQFNAVAVQGSAASGYKMVLAGYGAATSTSPYFTSVTRYSLSGALDTSFGGTGTGSFTTSGGLYFRSLALETDGSIIVGGYQRYVASDGTTRDQMAVGHLSADGVVDTSFGPNGTGYSYAQVGPSTQGWSNVAIDPLTGDIVLGGAIKEATPLPRTLGAAIARFTSPTSGATLNTLTASVQRTESPHDYAASADLVFTQASDQYAAAWLAEELEPTRPGARRRR